MRNRCAVAQAHDTVHDRRRVDDHLDPVVVEPEQEVSFDHLEALVRERRRVDRDLRPHRPRRVRKRLGRGHVAELGAGAATERAAARREDDAVGPTELRALEERGVLAVDGNEQATSPLLRAQGQLARCNEALLVGERQRDAALERPHRPRQAGEADRRVQDEIRLGALEQLGRVATDLRVRRETVDRRRAGGSRDELEARIRVDHLDRLAADRAGGPEEGDARHADSVPTGVSHRRAAAGRLPVRGPTGLGPTRPGPGRPRLVPGTVTEA